MLVGPLFPEVQIELSVKGSGSFPFPIPWSVAVQRVARANPLFRQLEKQIVLTSRMQLVSPKQYFLDTSTFVSEELERQIYIWVLFWQIFSLPKKRLVPNKLRVHTILFAPQPHGKQDRSTVNQPFCSKDLLRKSTISFWFADICSYC